MISLISDKAENGLCEWKCSTCHFSWEAQHPFSGCPQCRRKDREELHIFHEDGFISEPMMATEQIS